MRSSNRILTGAAALVVGLMLVACGAVESKPASLEVASIPSAEVLIDGASHGNTPATITLPAGTHKIVLQRDFFETHEATVDLTSGGAEKVDAVLVGTDPADAEVIRILAEASEVEVEAFVVPEAHRGSSNSDEMAVLLWPQRDVRLEALTSYGIEVSLDYTGDGYLEFKTGRTVLHREPFEPERVTTVAAMPEAVRDALKVNNSVTWGIVFDDKRQNVTGKFKVVKGTSAAKALAKLEKRRSFTRQPPITQALMRAQVLENKRLYTEALLANLAVVQLFPDSTSPYSGIVSTLRRMDAKDSELWGIASSFVRGRGPRSPGRRPAAGAGTAPGMATPGVTAPTARGPIADYDPGPAADLMGRLARGGMGSGDSVMPDPRPAPETDVPGTDPTVDPARPNDAMEDVKRDYRELATHEKHLGERVEEHGQRVEGLERSLADVTSETITASRQTERAERDAETTAQRARDEADAYDAAVAARDANPALPEPDHRPVEEAEQAHADAAARLDEAKAREAEALARKEGVSGELEEAREHLRVSSQELADVQGQTQGLREAFRSAGGDVQELDQGILGQPGPAPRERLGEAQELFREAEIHRASARRDVEMMQDRLQGIQIELEQAAGEVPPDTARIEDLNNQRTRFEAELETFRTQADEAGREADAAMNTLMQALDSMPQNPADPASAAKVELLGRRVADTGRALRDAQSATDQAEDALAGDPTNATFQAAADEALRSLQEAQRAFDAANEALGDVLR